LVPQGQAQGSTLAELITRREHQGVRHSLTKVITTKEDELRVEDDSLLKKRCKMLLCNSIQLLHYTNIHVAKAASLLLAQMNE
jgi:hypothetical protein